MTQPHLPDHDARRSGPSRRTFLAGALAAATAALLDPPQLALARQRAALLPVGDLFPLGVASGDPTADGVVLWTRLIAPSPGDPLPGADVAVDWQVAADEAFTTVVAGGTAPAVAALAHSVHVEATGLEADTWYWYRFTTDGRTSAVGRTRTFPLPETTPAEVRFALASCQNWSDGHYSAHAALAEEDVSLVVFVGDYIYERSKASGPRPISLPESLDLPTYRARYELYKGDASLQAVHHRFPWILTVDDHEVANNMIADLGKDGADAGNPAAMATWRARRADAYQAWYEHQPVRLGAPTSADYQIYRTVEHSALLRFFVLDGRQYRSAYPVGTESQGADTPERLREDRTMLGTAQEAWLDGRLAVTDARWNAIAQQTVMTAMPIPAGTSTFYNFDQWDGYVAGRNRLLRSLVNHRVRNPMILSGDIHLAAMAGVRLDYATADAPDIAHEVVATSISSGFDGALLDLVQAGLDAAPWSRYGNARQRGYALVTVTPEDWTTEFRVVASTATPTSTVRTDFTDVVTAREPVVVPPVIDLPPEVRPEQPPTGPGGPGAPPAAVPLPGSANYTG